MIKKNLGKIYSVPPPEKKSANIKTGSPILSKDLESIYNVPPPPRPPKMVFKETPREEVKTPLQFIPEVIKEGISGLPETIKESVGGATQKTGQFLTKTGILAANMSASALDYFTNLFANREVPLSRVPLMAVEKIGLDKMRGDWKIFYDGLKEDNLIPFEKWKESTDKLLQYEVFQPSKEWQDASLKDKFSTKHIGETIYEVGPSIIASMGPFLISPALGFGIIVGSTAGDVKDLAIEYGVEEKKADYLGLGTGLLVGLVDRITPSRILKKSKDKFIGSLVKRIVENGILETGTEISQELIQMAVENTFRDDLKWDEGATRVAMSALGGLLGGTGMTTIVSMAQRLKVESEIVPKLPPTEPDKPFIVPIEEIFDEDEDIEEVAPPPPTRRPFAESVKEFEKKMSVPPPPAEKVGVKPKLKEVELPIEKLKELDLFLEKTGGYFRETDTADIQKQFGNIGVVVKDVNGQRARMPINDFVEFSKNKMFSDRVRQVFIGVKTKKLNMKPEFDESFMEALQENGKLNLRIGKAPKIQKIEGVELINEAEITSQGMIKFLDAISNEKVRNALQMSGVKRLEIHPPYKFTLSEQAHIVKKEKLMRINADAIDPTDSIFHEVSHLLWDKLSDAQKKEVEKILRDNNIGAGYLKNNLIEEAFADNVFKEIKLQNLITKKIPEEITPPLKLPVEPLPPSIKPAKKQITFQLTTKGDNQVKKLESQDDNLKKLLDPKTEENLKLLNDLETEIERRIEIYRIQAGLGASTEGAGVRNVPIYDARGNMEWMKRSFNLKSAKKGMAQQKRSGELQAEIDLVKFDKKFKELVRRRNRIEQKVKTIEKDFEVPFKLSDKNLNVIFGKPMPFNRKKFVKEFLNNLPKEFTENLNIKFKRLKPGEDGKYYKDLIVISDRAYSAIWRVEIGYHEFGHHIYDKFLSDADRDMVRIERIKLKRNNPKEYNKIFPKEDIYINRFRERNKVLFWQNTKLALQKQAEMLDTEFLAFATQQKATSEKSFKKTFSEKFIELINRIIEWFRHALKIHPRTKNKPPETIDKLIQDIMGGDKKRFQYRRLTDEETRYSLNQIDGLLDSEKEVMKRISSGEPLTEYMIDVAKGLQKKGILVIPGELSPKERIKAKKASERKERMELRSKIAQHRKIKKLSNDVAKRLKSVFRIKRWHDATKEQLEGVLKELRQLHKGDEYLDSDQIQKQLKFLKTIDKQPQLLTQREFGEKLNKAQPTDLDKIVDDRAVAGVDEFRENKAQKIYRSGIDLLQKFTSRWFAPAFELERKLGKDIYAKIIKAIHIPERDVRIFNAQKLETRLEKAEKTFAELEKWFNTFSKGEQDAFMLSRGDPLDARAIMLKNEAVQKLDPKLLDPDAYKTVQEIADFNYKRLQEVAGDDINRVKDYFYGIYKNNRIDIDAFLKYWQSTKRYAKTKVWPTYADAKMQGLVLRNSNPVINLKQEFQGISRLKAFQELRDDALVTGKGIYIDEAIAAPRDWLTIPDWVFKGYRFEPTYARMMRSLISTNKVSQNWFASGVRKINNAFRTIKFLGSLFHMQVEAKVAIADSGYFGFYKAGNFTKVFQRGFRENDKILKTPDYLEYVALGGEHKYSLEVEAKNAFKKTFEKIRTFGYVGKAADYVLTPVKIPLGFVDWMFEKWIPKLKYAKYLENVEKLSSRKGGELTDAEKIDIIIEGQNFYGEMNERLFGRSGTATSAMRFFFMAPGFAEGNIRTNIKAFVGLYPEGGFKQAAKEMKYKSSGGARSRANIMNSFIVTGILATIGTLIFTGELPEKPKKLSDIRDLFKIDTGRLDNKGQKIFIDLMTYDKDYWELYGNIIIGNSREALWSWVKRIGGMKAPIAGVTTDLLKIMQGEAIYDWWGNKVYDITDPFLTQMMKLGAHEWERMLPISYNVYEQSRRKGVIPILAFAEAVVGIRPATSEADKRKGELFRRIYVTRGNQEELYYVLKTTKNPRRAIEEYNKKVDEVFNSPYLEYLSEEEQKYWRTTLYINIEKFLVNKVWQFSNPNIKDKDIEDLTKFFKNFGLTEHELRSFIRLHDKYDTKLENPYSIVHRKNIFLRTQRLLRRFE